jgi:threonine/homoserine/homoserine lactone efflux protein
VYRRRTQDNESKGRHLSQAIGDLLPSAVGVALSPIPIIAIILMLATPKGRSNGIAFSVGWIAGLVAVSVVVLLLAGGADSSSGTNAGVNWIKLALGVVFLVMAGGQWRNRPTAGQPPRMPKWMESIDSFSPAKSGGLGVVLSAANPKNLALTFAAAASIAQAGLSGGESAVAVLVFVLIASITVVGPVAFYLVAPSTAERPLTAVNEFMSDHNAVIMMTVLLVLGAKLIGNGISGLAS